MKKGPLLGFAAVLFYPRRIGGVLEPVSVGG